MMHDETRSWTPWGLLAILLLIGCGDVDFRPEAQGEEGKITVVIDSVLWQGSVGDALRDQLSAPIFTLPSQEPLFSLEPMNLVTQQTLDVAQGRKNVVFVASLDDTTTNEARFIRSILSEEARQAIQDGGTAVVPRKDVWRRHQQVFYITAATPEGLVAALQQDGPGIVHKFNEVTRQRLHRDMFDIGRQPDIEQYLMNNHGFAVNGQHDYVVASDTNNFVWLRRNLSDTWRSLFIYYEENADPAKLSPDWIYDTRDALTRRHVQGTLGGWVEVDRRRPLTAEEINFKDRYAYEIRGLWHMVGEENGEKFPFGAGGPFLTYAFYDEHTGRLYLIDGMVFAPNYPKREFLRQLEVIAYTFRTRQEEEQAAQMAAR